MSYDLLLEPEVHAARDELPGNMRQRVRRVISALASAPRLPESAAMDTAGLDLRDGVELRRIRLERWVWVLAVRRRPPYGYDDLPELIARLSG